MGTLITSITVFFTLVYAAACTPSRQMRDKDAAVIQNPVKMRFDKVQSFKDLIDSQSRYGGQYQKLLDSLNLNSADTVGFFIRPCFTHYGTLFRIEHSKCKEYFFKFSDSYTQVHQLGDRCVVGSNYFSFIGDHRPVPKRDSQDSVIIVPDCPVVLFTKLKDSFYYRKIDGYELKYFSDNSAAFKRLLQLTVQMATDKKE